MSLGEFARHRRARPLALVAVPLVLGGLRVVSASGVTGWLDGVERATRGLVPGEAVLAAGWFALILGLILLVGAIEPSDAGLDGESLLSGLALTAMVWAMAQVVAAVPRVVAEQGLVPDPALARAPLREAGRLVEALAVSAADGLAFRGFLLVQLYLRFQRGTARPRDGLGRALLLSQLVAVAALFPAALLEPRWTGLPALLGATALPFGVALLVSWIYLRTANLVFAIGVHALILAPLPALARAPNLPDWIPSLAVGVVAGVVAGMWPRR